MLKKIKDDLYYYFARKNWGVCREYEPYVNLHQEEHSKAPEKHWWLLVRLNWHYRVLRKTTYLLNIPVPTANVSRAEPPKGLSYPESKAYERESVNNVVEKLSAYDIISFDIFDTLILRPFETPDDLFGVLALEMGRPDFKDIRLSADRAMRILTNKPNNEINLYDTYRYIEEVYKINADKWSRREIELEKEFCYANSYMKEIYDKLIANGKTVIATSDMYLPGGILTELLHGCGYTEIKKVFVSCDYTCCKATGQLQRIVQKFCGQDKRYIQVGDNYISDIQGSESCGWGTYYYENINQRGAQYRPVTHKTLARSIYCGIVNAELHAAPKTLAKYYEFGFVYGGFLVCGYCEWLNRLAKSEGIDKFLFISRDGDIISKVYNKFYKEVDNAYILASRFALFQAGFEEHFQLFWDNVIQFRQGQTLGTLFRETDLSFLTERLTQYGLSSTDVFRVSNYEVLKGMLYAERETIAEHFKPNRAAALEYIAGFLDGYKKVCLVDVGWTGTGPLILSDLIAATHPETSAVTALLATRDVFVSEERLIAGTMHCYLYSMFQNRDLIPPNLTVSSTVIELIFSAPHPSMLQYTWEDGAPAFIFEDGYEDNYAATREIQRGILQFAKIYNQITQNRKDMFRISAYEALAPLKAFDIDFRYIETLFGTHKHAACCGNKESTPITVRSLIRGTIRN